MEAATSGSRSEPAFNLRRVVGVAPLPDSSVTHAHSSVSEILCLPFNHCLVSNKSPASPQQPPGSPPAPQASTHWKLQPEDYTRVESFGASPAKTLGLTVTMVVRSGICTEAACSAEKPRFQF